MASSKRFIDYPRAGRTGVRRWLPSWKLLLSTAVLLVVLAFGALAAAVVFVRVPQPNDMARAQVTTFYWNDGQTVLGRMGEANRTNVPLSDVPQPVQHAVLAAEDRDFYEHGGFSPTALARAVWNNVRGGDTQGASTITQQYAKNAFLTQERSYIRKAKELVLSLKIETQISKDEILSNYMNTVYYGRSAYGIEAASQAYFGVPAKDLTVAQGAMLAALLQSPNGLSPTKNPQGLQDRWNYVLDGMVAKGWLTPAERAAQKFPEVKAYTPPANYYQGTDGYLFAAAQRDMLNHGFTEDQLNTEGLNVKTTFDRTAQAAAVDAVTNNSPGGEEEGLRIGLASVTPNTGAVVAMYGGPDYQKNQFNNASQARGQAGSTFKAFGLAAGLENNVGLDSYYDGNSPQRIDGQLIENEFNQSYGTISMLKATPMRRVPRARRALATTSWLVGPEGLSIRTNPVGISSDSQAGRGIDAARRRPPRAAAPRCSRPPAGGHRPHGRTPAAPRPAALWSASTPSSRRCRSASRGRRHRRRTTLLP